LKKSFLAKAATRWSKILRLPFSATKKSSQDKKPRVKNHQVHITRRRVVLISLRRFRLAKTYRAKTFRQLVIPLPKIIKGYRQATFRIKKLSNQKALNPRLQLSFSSILSLFLVIFGLSGIAYFGSKLALAQIPATVPLPAVEYLPLQSVRSKAYSLPESEPLQISIPKIELESDVSSVGKVDDGSMEVPNLNEWITGWYRYSPTPGEIGPAVIVGHVDGSSGPSVFWRLSELEPNDKITVLRKDGTQAEFIVERLAQYNQNDFPTTEVYGDIEYAGLRLITCGGDFDWLRLKYSQNTVVYASLVE
jgi:hypothetical protein